MKVGIVLNYIRHDFTYAALKTAEALRNMGYSITLFDKSVKSVRARLHSYWNDFVLSDREAHFDDWLDDCDIVIWFTYPTAKEVKTLYKNNIPNICVASWDSVDSETVSAIKSCDAIICPSKAQKAYLQEYWRLKEVTYIPFDSNYPLTNPGKKIKDKVKVMVACPGYQLKRVDHSKLFSALYAAMETNHNLDIDFLYSSKVASQLKINIPKYSKVFDAGNELLCVDDPTGWSEGPLAYALCDIVLWPVQLESFSYVAVESLTMGTPVIAYNHLPMSEIITDHVNGFLIPCERRETELGLSYAVHNGDGMVSLLSKICSDTSLIDKVKLGTHKGLEDRKNAFYTLWDGILDNVSAYKPRKGKK